MEHSQETPEPEQRKYPFSAKTVVLIWLGCIVFLIAAMVFVLFTVREISPYASASFEAAARKAIEAHKYGRAVRICTGALRLNLGHSEFWGLAHLLRAEAHAAAGDLPKSLADARYSARFWTKTYYAATAEHRAEIGRLGTDLALKLLEKGDAADAKKALSAGGVGSGDPAKYLRDQSAALNDTQRAALWPDGVLSLTLEDFEGADAPAFEQTMDQQERKLHRGATPGDIEVTESKKDGKCWCQIPLYIPLNGEQFALRTAVKEKTKADVAIVISYWFELAQKAAVTFDRPAKEAGDGLEQFDIRRNFTQQRIDAAKKEGYDPAGGIMYRIGLDIKPGPANTFTFKPIELYLPQQ